MNKDIRQIQITTEYIKLDQLLKLSGLCTTGGNAKESVLKGKVKVNGEFCLLRGKKLKNADTIEYNGILLEVCHI